MIIKIDNEQADLIRRLGWLSSVGIVLVACIFLGLAIGYYLDKWLHTAPCLTLGFLLFGVVAGFWNSFEMIMRCLKEPSVGNGCDRSLQSYDSEGNAIENTH